MPRRKPRSRDVRKRKQSRRWPALTAMGLLLSALAALLSCLILFKLPPMTFYSGDCGTKLLQVQSLVMQGWKTPALLYPGEAIDPGHRFVETGALVVRKGRVWGVHSATFAALSSLPYSWFGYKGLYVVPALSLLGAVLLLPLLAKGICGPWQALLAMALTAFCSPLLFYGVDFWEHTLAVFLVISALLLLLPAVESIRRPPHIMAGAALLAAAYTVRPETAAFFLAAALGLALTIRPGRALARALGFMALGGAAVLVPTAFVNQTLFGDPWGTLLGLHLRSGLPDPRLLIVGKLLIPTDFGVLWKLLAAIIAGLVVWQLSLREARHQRGWPTTGLGLLAGGIVAVIAVAEWQRLSALWRQPAEITSLVEAFPIIWVLPICLAAHRADVQARVAGRLRFLGVTVAAYLVGVLATSPTWGGAQWGPRQLLLAVPLLALLAARFGSPRLASGRIALLALGVFALISLGIQISGIQWVVRLKGLYANTVVQFDHSTEPGDVMVSDDYWFQEILAPIYYQRRFFYLSSADLTGDFLQALRNSGVTHFHYHFRRGGDPTSIPQDVTSDLMQQLAKHSLLGQGLTMEHCTVITDSPYYFVRFGTGVAADGG